MSAFTKNLVDAVERMARRFGGSTFVMAAIDKTLDAEQRRIVLRHLIYNADHDTMLEAVKDALSRMSKRHREVALETLLCDDVDPTSPTTGLPQKLRGAVHALAQRYPRNQVVDAAMLELPEQMRHDVARAFLLNTKKPLRETLEEQRAEKAAAKAKLYILVDAGSGEELGKVEPGELSQHLRIVDGKTGQPRDYVQVRIIPEYDFREHDDAPPRMLAIYRQAGGPTA